MSQISKFRQLKKELSKQKKGSKEDLQIRTEMKKIALQYKNNLIYKGPIMDDFEDLFDNNSNNNSRQEEPSWTQPFNMSNLNKTSLNELDDVKVVYKDDMNNNLSKRMNNDLDILNLNTQKNKNKECISPYASGGTDMYASF